MIEFRSVGEGDLDSLRIFLAENGWDQRVANAERFQRMLENANRTVIAIEDQRIIGFARALSDDASNGYIGTVAVAENKRGQGIGREMVKRLMGDDPNITWVLRAGHGSEEFWKRVGFEPSEVAMERRRK